MKKTLITLLLSTSLLFLVGCGSKNTINESNTSSSNNQVESSNKEDSNSKKESEDKNTTKTKEETPKKESENTTVEKNEETNISIFLPNDNADGLSEKHVTVNHLTAYSIINALADNGVVPKGTKAINFDVKNNIGYLDVSSSIYNLHSGSTGETLMLDAIRETFLKAFNVQKVKLTVDGSTYTGSHVDLSSDDFL